MPSAHTGRYNCQISTNVQFKGQVIQEFLFHHWPINPNDTHTIRPSGGLHIGLVLPAKPGVCSIVGDPYHDGNARCIAGTFLGTQIHLGVTGSPDVCR